MVQADGNELELWFITGSQHLYGEKALRQVSANAQQIATSLAAEKTISLKVVFKPIVTRPEEIRAVCREASASSVCAGVILWMHTFSPGKMWIGGLNVLTKPMLHLHTQFNRELPWATIDMDFMNLNQAAHGDREFGHIAARLKLRRKVVVGFWKDAATVAEIAGWARAGTSRRTCACAASATTCARSRSPKATRWKRSGSSASA
jgi:L-arabinose isomerase